MKGLSFLIKLEKLNLAENSIDEIKGLDSLIHLERLYLKGNKITNIRGLKNLNSLENLDLNHNPIIKSELKIIEDYYSHVKARKAIRYSREMKKIKENR